MIEIYIVDGREFKVHSSRKEEFLQKYPNALLKQTEPGKTSPTAPGAVVEETVAPASQSTDLDLVNTSSGLTPGEQLSQQDLLRREAVAGAISSIPGGIPIGPKVFQNLLVLQSFLQKQRRAL